MVGDRVPLPPSEQLRKGRGLNVGFSAFFYCKLLQTISKYGHYRTKWTLRPPATWNNCLKKVRPRSICLAGPMPIGAVNNFKEP